MTTTLNLTDIIDEARKDLQHLLDFHGADDAITNIEAGREGLCAEFDHKGVQVGQLGCRIVRTIEDRTFEVIAWHDGTASAWEIVDGEPFDLEV